MQPSAPSMPPALARYQAILDEGLRAALPVDGSDLVAAARYVMGWDADDGARSQSAGKRIRPSLCLFAAETLGGTIAEALPGAVAIELVHNFSLVHDEIQDRDAERHHRPTTWARLGEAQAINVGDYLYTRAIHALTVDGGNAERRLRALQILHSAIAEMIAGQWQDIAFEGRARIAEEDYIQMVAAKTGALLAAPLEIGATLAGTERALAAAISSWGLQVGLAFQIWDDYLGAWGDPDVTGKPAGSDIRRKKKTFPVVVAMRDGRAAEVLSSVFAMEEVDDAAASDALRALEESGARERTRVAAEGYASAAAVLLGDIPIDA
ncbi:MAG: polyprenyl synthetase family protein, partial [Dehalococcoidia bacterium]